MAKPPGKGNARRYQRIAGDKARRYKDTVTGETISRRQFTQRTKTKGASLERRASERRAAGVPNKLERYTNVLRSRQELEYFQTGKKRSLRTIQRDPEFRKIISDLRSKSNAARGAKARALTKLGLRDSTWTFAVGETPKGAVSDFRLNTQLAQTELTELEKMIRRSERSRQAVNRTGRIR